jgi:hypothetical protein
MLGFLLSALQNFAAVWRGLRFVNLSLAEAP